MSNVYRTTSRHFCWRCGWTTFEWCGPKASWRRHFKCFYCRIDVIDKQVGPSKSAQLWKDKSSDGSGSIPERPTRWYYLAFDFAVWRIRQQHRFLMTFDRMIFRKLWFLLHRKNDPFRNCVWVVRDTGEIKPRRIGYNDSREGYAYSTQTVAEIIRRR